MDAYTHPLFGWWMLSTCQWSSADVSWLLGGYDWDHSQRRRQLSPSQWYLLGSGWMHRRSLDADCERCTCTNCEYHSRSLSQISYDTAKSTFLFWVFLQSIKNHLILYIISVFTPNQGIHRRATGCIDSRDGCRWCPHGSPHLHAIKHRLGQPTTDDGSKYHDS